MTRALFNGLVGVALATLPLLAATEQAAAQRAPQTGGGAERLADGTPNISGLWNAPPAGGGRGNAFQQPTVDERGNIILGVGGGREGTLTNFERDSSLAQRADVNRPQYKPEHWPRVQWYDDNGNKEDPEFHCFPAGVPRMGPPTKIVQTPTEMIFLYNQRNTFRTIYMDGRSHPPEDQWEGRWYGHSVGRWEGDTLVIDSVDFTDASWLGWPGWIHSDDMRVEERIRRDGDLLHWQATVHDPEMLLKPWTTTPVMRRLNRTPGAELPEDLPCSERDAEHLVTRERG
jgi:hypothetical protein